MITRGLRDWTIGRRLGVGFALIAVMFLVLAGAIWRWNAQSAAAQATYTERVAPLDVATRALDRRVLNVEIAVRTYLLNPGDDTLTRVRATIDEARIALAQLGALGKDAVDQALYADVAPRARDYLDEAARLVGDAGKPGPMLEAAERSLTEARGRVVAAIGRLADRQDTHTTEAIAAMEAARERSTTGVFAAIAISFAVLLLLAILIARAIRDPARELVRVASALEQGDAQPAAALSVRIRRMLGGVAPRGEMPQLALSFARAAEAIDRREARLRADGEVGAAAGSTLVEHELAAAVLPAICRHVGADVGVLYALEADGAALVPIATQALRKDAAALAFGDGIPGQAARARKLVVMRDIPADSAFTVKIGFAEAPPRTVAAVPLVAHDVLIGVVLVASLRDIDAAGLEFLEAAARQVAGGLENVRAYARITRLMGEVGESNARVQAQNEELQAQNEELQSQSEEIQAQNEEMQAQAEEMQAQAEKLKTQTEEMTTYANSLAESDRRKSEFLGVLAHELRNPMAAISNGLYALTHAGVDESMRRRAEGIIGRQSRVLSRLVDDLLDITRIGSGKVRLQRESVDLVDVVRDCVNDHRELAAASHLAVELVLPPEPLVVTGDRVRLCQVVGNLLDNAAKFSEKGTVRVLVRHAHGSDEAELVVADNGIGIEPAVLGRLFQPFSQADTSLARGRSGLGLGLALVKSLVEMHGGTVRAHSDGLGAGAQFTMRLPLARAVATPAPVVLPPRSAHVGGAAPEPAPARRGRRVLIIEDNLDAAASLRDALRLLGHAVHVAHDAQEGIDSAHEFRPDVVLCDIGLPTMDGYQVAQKLRADPNLRSIFLIAVTGYAGPDDQERAARAGFDRHFGKPPDIERLNRILEDVPQQVVG